MRNRRDIHVLRTVGALSRWTVSALRRLAEGYVDRRLGGQVEVRIRGRFRFLEEDYEREGMEWVFKVLREGDIAIDVGANIGLYSLVMGRLVGPTGRVYSFEPAKESYRALREHIELNSLDGIIEAYQVLVGSEHCLQRFFEDGFQGTNRVGGSKFDGPRTVCTYRPTILLDEFLPKWGSELKLMKIDVEGHEFKVLQGARETLQRSQCLVLCEMHPNLWHELGHDWRDIQAFLGEIGYGLYEYHGGAAVDFPNFLLHPVQT